MHDLPVGRVHGLEGGGDPGFLDLVRHACGKPLDGGPSRLAVLGHIDEQPSGTGTELALHDGAGEVLDRHQRLPLGSDQQAQVVACYGDLDGFLVQLLAPNLARQLQGRKQPLEELLGHLGFLSQ